MSTPPATDIQSTGLKNSCFDFRIERNGRDGLAELTYNLNDAPPSRRLLRVREQDAIRLFPGLANNGDFRLFRDHVNSLQARGLANMSIAKGIVLEQFDASEKNPSLGIAVHKMGPVPVFLLPDTLVGTVSNIHLFGQEIHPTIGVYPSFAGGERLIKHDLLRSYGIQLDIMLRKYLEDVGEHFHDIENYLPRIDVFSRAKKAETVLQQSIEQKIEFILRYSQPDADSQLQATARDVWNRFQKEIITAALARVFALHLINELYRMLGVADKSAKYEQDWTKFHQIFANLYGESEFEALFRPDTELFLLREARTQYIAQNEDSEFEPVWAQAEHRKIRWVQDFVAFARFIAGLRRESPTVGTGRLFLSMQHNVGGSSNLYQSLDKYITTRSATDGRPPAQILAVINEPHGTNIERLAQARIWLSDGLLAIIPKEWKASATGDPKDLDWIVREVDYGILLERWLRLFIEEGIDRPSVEEEFRADVKPISPTQWRYDQQQQKQRRLQHLQNVLNGSFSYKAATQLGEDVKKQIDDVIDAARARHTRDVVVGFIKQFEHPQTMAKILSLTTYPRGKTWICGRIADERRQALVEQRLAGVSNRALKRKIRDQIRREVAKYERLVGSRFEGLRKANAARGLMIQGKSWHLLYESGAGTGRTYKSNLRDILRALMPEAEDERLEAMHNRVFKLVLESPSPS